MTKFDLSLFDEKKTSEGGAFHSEEITSGKDVETHETKGSVG